MARGRWFRMYDEVVDHPKVQRLSDRAFRAWVNLMCLASRGEGRISGDLNELGFCLRKPRARVGELLDTLRRLGQSPRVIILRLRLMPLLDASGAQALEEFVEQARLAGAEIILSGVQPQPRPMLDRVGLGETSAKVSHAADYAHAQSLAAELLARK